MVDQDWSGEAGRQLHKDWFRSTSAAPVKRPGYCLGLHVVALLARTHALREMARWDEPTYLPSVKTALRTLADGGDSGARFGAASGLP